MSPFCEKKSHRSTYACVQSFRSSDWVAGLILHGTPVNVNDELEFSCMVTLLKHSILPFASIALDCQHP